MHDILANLARIAGVIMAISYIPQQYRIIKNKSSENVSISMFGLVFAAICIYEAYAISIMEPVFLFTNTLGLIQSGILLCLIIKYRR